MTNQTHQQEAPELVEIAARAMVRSSRPGADPDRPQPAPRGKSGIVPLWRLYEHMAEAAVTDLLAALELQSPSPGGEGPAAAMPDQHLGGLPADTAPAACHVLAGRFDGDVGDWVFAVVSTPLCTPFTHWWPLPDLAATLTPSHSGETGEVEVESSPVNAGNIVYRGEEWVPLSAYREAMDGWKAANRAMCAAGSLIDPKAAFKTSPDDGGLS